MDTFCDVFTLLPRMNAATNKRTTSIDTVHTHTIGVKENCVIVQQSALLSPYVDNVSPLLRRCTVVSGANHKFYRSK